MFKHYGAMLALVAIMLGACGETAGNSPTTQTTPASSQVLLDFKSSGTKSTEKFTVASDWDLQWFYDCTAGLTRDGAIPSGYHCSFIVSIKQADGRSSTNQSVNQLGVKDQGV